MKNPICPDPCMDMATVLSLSETGWTTTNVRSFGNRVFKVETD